MAQTSDQSRRTLNETVGERMMVQTDLFKSKIDTTTPPYNGLFYCHIRSNFFRWAEFIGFYREKRL